jgi:hypothetical protein
MVRLRPDPAPAKEAAMETPPVTLKQRIRALEDQIEAEVDARRARFRYRLEARRVVFEEGVRRRHAAQRPGLWSYIAGIRPLVALSAPVIYALIVPLALLDLMVVLYQAVCFPVYGIARVRRRDHIVLDRAQLDYLNALEKLNCAYCSYANGVLAFAREVAARTEQYWCPIKHARRIAGAHARYADFLDYGDAESYRSDLARLRADLREARDDG